MVAAEKIGRGVLFDGDVLTATTYADNLSEVFQDIKNARATVVSVASDQAISVRLFLEDPTLETETTMTEIQYETHVVTAGTLKRIELDFGLGSRLRVRVENTSGTTAAVKIWAFSVA